MASWGGLSHWNYYSLSEDTPTRCVFRDENEKAIFKAIKENDAQALEKILKNPVGVRLGSQDIAILSAAVLNGDCEVIKFLIDSGCDSREIDKNGNTALHLLVSEYMRSNVYIYGDLPQHRLAVVDILLGTCANAFEIVFLNANLNKMTPFLLACALECDPIIKHFLTFLTPLENRSISIDKFIGFGGNNVFHFLLGRSTYRLPSTRIDTVQALIDKIPFCDQLIDQENRDGETPLGQLLRRGLKDWSDGMDLVRIALKHGASPDHSDRRGMTYLHRAILMGNVTLLDILLRAGCRTGFFEKNESALFYGLKYHWRKSNLQSIRMIELFLAFGYDLQQELYLYTIDERPLEFSSPENAARCDTSEMDPDILEALRELRRSNKMFSLQRQCRNTLRRYLKGKTDEVIRSLTCIPDRIKSYLLVENEPTVLEITQ